MNSRINIFCGHFGSGKTEVSLNYAIKLAEEGKKVTIIDLDIVNPYFRTADAEKILKEHNIELIASEFANSNLDIQDLIDKYVFPGGPAEIRVGSYEKWKVSPEEVDVITITKDNYESALAGAAREQFFGRLMRFEGLKCHYAGVANHEGKTAPAIKNGSYDNMYPSWMYTDPRPTVSQPWYRWAFRETDVTADGEEYATGRSLYGSVLFTYRDDLLAQKEGDTGMQGSENGIYVVRTSGYSRFANRPLCKDGEKADITALFGIYSKKSDYTGGEYDYATYQLTLNRFEDMDFEKGPNAFLSEEQIASMTTEEMKYVPWMDEEGEIGE